jgi:hypothetical protein
MARWSGEVTVVAVDAGRLAAVVPAVLERLRRLEFVDGVALDPAGGGPIPGLRLVAGEHPRAGSRYDVEIAHVRRSDNHARIREALDAGRPIVVPGIGRVDANDPRAKAFVDGLRRNVGGPVSDDRWQIDLVRDGDNRCELAGREVRADRRPPTTWTGTIVRPAHVDRVEIGAVQELGGSRSVAGRVEMSAIVHVDRLPDRSGRARGDGALAEATLRHRRLQITGRAEVEPVDGRTWRVRVRGSGRGRGVVRPVVAIVWLFAGRRARRSLQEILDQLPDVVAQLDRATRRDTDAVADEVVARLLRDLSRHA